jgi:RIO kinase 1
MSILQKALLTNFNTGMKTEQPHEDIWHSASSSSSSDDDDDDCLHEMDDFGISFKKGARKDEQDLRQNLNKVENREVKITHSIMNKISQSAIKESKNKVRVKDKQDRATVEQCLDPRTRVILHKLVNTGFLSEINGCLSTGKEANVYHAVDSQGIEYAIKIYKTSILVFKDRDRYVAGEFRYRNGHCKSNPRKMIKLWAEKEFRNLKRIEGNPKLRCPEAMVIKSNVLVMKFIGKSMEAAPKLREV